MPVRRLITETEIHEAALWRLAGWSEDELAAGSARLARLIERGIELASDQPEVAQALGAFAGRKERREAWSALMALAVLHADAHGDADLFLRAGFEVVGACRNARARQRCNADAGNVLTDMIAEFQANRPQATADELFDFWADLAGGDHPIFADHDGRNEVLTYDDRGKLRTVRRDSFRRQFRRVQEKSRTQRVVVRRAA